MRLARAVLVVTLLATCPFALPSHAAETGFLPQDAVDLLMLLPPPPRPQDARNRAELEELRRLQEIRTPERVEIAEADLHETIFRFLVVFDKPLTPTQLPKTTAFFKKLEHDEDVPTEVAKKSFGRLRPYAVTNVLRPACPLSDNPSYPSGHATFAYHMGIVLAAMVPEERAAIFARAQEFAESRMVCGVHYRSDIEAGRIAGTVLAALVMNEPQFKAEFAAARAELRTALGM